MSLKAFHLLFIIASIALAAMMGVWGSYMYASGRGAMGHLAFAALSFAAGGALVWYFKKFVRKSREIGLE